MLFVYFGHGHSAQSHIAVDAQMCVAMLREMRGLAARRGSLSRRERARLAKNIKLAKINVCE